MNDRFRTLAHSVLPSIAKDAARELADLSIPTNVESYRAFRHAKRTRTPAEPVSLSVRQLRGARIMIRPGTRDAACAHYTFVDQFHLPPPDLKMPAEPIIWDLGANIGLTMAHLAVRFPQARVWGIELDAANAELARRNVSPWIDRCIVLTGAVWSADGEVEYSREAVDEDAYSVVAEQATNGSTQKATAFSLNSLLRQNGSSEAVDYVKMDIEGAERAVLRENTGWANHVRSIKVEVHTGYSVTECVDDIQSLGFRTRRDDKHRGAVIGIRDR